MIADAVQVVPSVQRGGVAELAEGQVEGARGGDVRQLLAFSLAVVESTLVLLWLVLMKRLVFALYS